MHTHMYIYMHMFMYTYTQTHTHMDIRTHMHMHTHVHTPADQSFTTDRISGDGSIAKNSQNSVKLTSPLVKMRKILG